MAHFLKFAVVGLIGFFINTIVLIFGVKIGFSPSLSGPAGAELAVISNFILNNFWTFSDKSITSWQVVPMKFLTFNVLSLGSLVIQFIFLKTGEKISGSLIKFKEPIWKIPFFSLFAKWGLVKIIFGLPFVGKIAKNFSAYLVFYILGVGVGLIVNYFVYSQIIWK